MSNNIVALPGSGYVSPIEGKEKVISCLEDMLQDARNGQLVSIAICGVTADRSVATNYEGGSDLVSLMGAVEMLRHRIQIETHSE